MHLSFTFLASIALQAGFTKAAGKDANLTVALVRAPPPAWPLPVYSYDWADIKPQLELFDRPGFPKGSGYNNWTKTHLPTYIENTMVVGGPEWKRLVSTVQETKLYAGINFAQRIGDNLYMAQALISPLGDELIFRHKLRPSGVERDIFSDGTMDQLKVITSAYVRVGMLECGENWYPSMTFPMQAHVENFHLGPFPYMGDRGDDNYLWWEEAEANSGAVGLYSNLAGAYSFVAAVGHSFVSSPLAQVVASISANASFEDHPMLYHSLDTTSFDKSETYDSDSQAS